MRWNRLCLLLVASVGAGQQPLRSPAEQLEGRWRICFVMDSSVNTTDRSSRMVCGNITLGTPRKPPKPPIASADTADFMLNADHDVRFASMLGAEPGQGQVGSGTVITFGRLIILALNAPRGELVFDDHSVHARAELTDSTLVRGTWEPSCFSPCAEHGSFFMRRLGR